MKKILLILSFFILLTPFQLRANELSEDLKGRILLQVEDHGEAWYINPTNNERIFLNRPKDAFEIMRNLGVGITNDDLEKIPVSLHILSGKDTDLNGLPDDLEISLGTDINKGDYDNDGYSDYSEIEGGYDPKQSGKLPIDESFTKKHAGKIFIQTERNGEAWYLNPVNNQRYFLGRPLDAFNIMRQLGLGISNSNLEKIAITNEQQNIEEPIEKPIEKPVEDPIEEPEKNNISKKEFSDFYLAKETELIADQRILPILKYSPEGDLRLFYTDTEPYAGNFYYKLKERNQNTFSEEILFGKDMKSIDLLYKGNNISKAVVSRYADTQIFTPEENNTWLFEEGYVNNDKGQIFPSYYPSYIFGDENNATLFLGFNYDTHVYGSHCTFHLTKMTNGEWQNDSNEINESCDIKVYQDRNNIAVHLSDKRSSRKKLYEYENYYIKYIYFSTDGGKNFTRLAEENPHIDKIFKSLYKIRVSHPYYEGSRNFILTESNDLGITYTKETNILSDIDYEIQDFKLIETGSNMLVVYKRFDDKNSIKGVFSADKGQTWTEPFDLINLNINTQSTVYKYKDNFSFDINASSDTITLAYVDDKNSEHSLFVKEFKLK